MSPLEFVDGEFHSFFYSPTFYFSPMREEVPDAPDRSTDGGTCCGTNRHPNGSADDSECLSGFCAECHGSGDGRTCCYCGSCHTANCTS